MVKVEKSIKTLRIPEGMMSEEELTEYGLQEGGELLNQLEPELDLLVFNPHEPNGMPYTMSNFQVVHTILWEDYDLEENELLVKESFHFVSIGLENKLLVVWFEQVVDEFDPEFGALNYDYTGMNYGIINEGDYLDYLLTVNQFQEVI